MASLIESLEETARSLVEQATRASSQARQAANDWRGRTGETELPADIAWAWNAAQDLKQIAEAVYSHTISLGDAMRRVESRDE
jgi:hypothetical protein